MKKTAIAAALALSLGASVAQAQTSDPRGWYAGIDVGVGRSRASGLSDDTDTFLGINGGYRFNRHLAAEAGYARLGHFTPSYDASAGSIAAIGILPLKYGFSAYGKVGYARTHVGGAGTSDDANSALFGLGAYYDLNRQWFLKAGWDHYTKVGGSQTGEGSLDTYTLGVGFRF